jgi:MoaA/NifB/PqqE/SkfB family radical SAM enzyme
MLKFCSAPWKQVQIHKDGTVQACLCGIWNTAGDIGNILEKSMGEIMQAENIKRLRQGVLDQSFSMCTDTCPYKWTTQQVEEFPKFVHDETPMPAEILLAIDLNCNLKCPMCRPGSIFAKEIEPTAQLILDKLIDSYKETTTPTVLQMDGAGDVFASEAWRQFLRRDDIPECFNFHIITNGNLVLKNKDIIMKHRKRIISVDVSLDATEEDTYSQVRGGKLSVVIKGMEWMRQQGIRTSISFVAQRRNYKQMLACWQLARELGCHSINFQGIKRLPHMTEDYWQYTKLEDNPDVDMVYLREALTELSNAPTVVDFSGKAPPPVYMDGELRRFA